MKKFLFTFLCFASLLRAVDQLAVAQLKALMYNTLPTLHGWCTYDKACAFIDLVLEEEPDVCVEIGAFGGASVLPVASALKLLDHGVIIAIDAWDKVECIRHFDPNDDEAHLDYWGKVNFEFIYYNYVNVLRRFEIEPYTITMKTTSEKAAAVIGLIDFLYIDGNHTETGSTRDVILYLPKVRSGGLICINDCLWPQMQRAVELLNEACDPVQLIDNGNAVVFRKR